MIRTDRLVTRSISILLCALLVLLIVPSAPQQAHAFASIYVDVATGNDTTGDGSIGSPYKTIGKGNAQAFIDGGGNVYVNPGTYNVASGETFPISIQVGNMIVGMSDGVVVDAAGSGQAAFYCENGNGSTGLESLTITGGNSSERGGGIRILNTINQNRPIIRRCTFVGNQSADAGGGIAVENAKASIVDCAFEENTAQEGGGIAVIGSAASAIVSDCTFTGDTAVTSGGGAHVYQGIVSVYRCTFTGTQGGANWQGGAISVQDVSSFFMADSTLSECSAGVGGGIYLGQVDSASIYNSVFDRCAAAIRGGAISASDSSLSLYSSTLVGNTAVSSNDTLHFASAMPQTIDIWDAIVWDESGDEIGPLPTTVEYSCVSNAAVTGTGVIHTNPMFVSTTGAVDYQLKNGSPCIDTGDPASALDYDLLNADRPLDGNGDTVAVHDMGAYEHPVPVLERLEGTDRYKTACEIWRSEMSSAQTAIIVTGENFPDALSASALAGAVNGPLLLVQKNAIPAAVTALLSDFGVTDCIIVGGETVVSPGVENMLKNTYIVSRIDGTDRYATAAKVALEVKNRMGRAFPGAVFVATGASFPDALAASPIAYATGMPILLTRTTALPADSTNAIEDVGATEAIVVGSDTVVSAAVYNQLGTTGSITTRDRWYGANRYETARDVASEAVDAGLGAWQYTGIATGTNFPDALAGGAAAGSAGGVLLLTDPTTLSSATRGAITTNKAKIFSIHIFGSDKAVTTSVRNAIDAIWP